MLTVILLRHGRSVSNTAHTLAGRSEGVELDAKGVGQAGALVERLAGLPIKALVRSPLLRCRLTLEPLAMPVDAEFRVGTMGLGWDAEAQNVVVELLEATDTELDASVILDDAEDGPDAVRVFLSPESARKFATRSQRVISAGRPPCPLCVEPLDPDGHVCVRTNGYRRGGPLAAGDDSEP